MKLNGINISMVRGDSESLTVTCSTPFSSGDTVFLTVREDAESDIAMQKVVTEFPNGEAVFIIEPDDTEGLDFGNYVYDIQVTWAGGVVKTLVGPARWRLTEEVTY